VTANNTDASNVTYNTGVLKYNGATSTLEMDKPLSVTALSCSGTAAFTGNTNLRTTVLGTGYDITRTGTPGALFARLATAEQTVGGNQGNVAIAQSTLGTHGTAIGNNESRVGVVETALAGLTADDLGTGGSLTLGTLSVSDGGGGATAGMVIADGKITANDGVDVNNGHLSCTNGVKLQDGIQTYQAHVDASASQPRLWTGISRLQAIMAASQIDPTKVMKCNFVSLPMNSGYAPNDYVTGTGHTNTPQTKKYSNHYQTVFDGTVGTDLTLFTKTQTSVASSAYSVNVGISSTDYSPTGSTLTDVIINGTGYIYWAASSFPTSVSRKNNKLIRVGH
jgi:hypothetical protein